MSAFLNRRLLLSLLVFFPTVFTGRVAFFQDVSSDEKSFSVVLLPDTQFYSEKYPMSVGKRKAG